MKNNKLLRYTKNIFPLIILGSVLLSFPFIGTECGTIVNGQLISLRDIAGTWKLVKQTGYLIDICPDEVVTFNNDYTAVILCPGKDSVRKSYVVNVQFKTLTYTESQVTYNYQSIDSANSKYLKLYGVNIGRNLFYQMISNTDKFEDFDVVKGNKTVNSSDLKK